MLSFCPANDTFIQVWANKGFSRCFVEAVSPTVLFVLIFISFIIQLRRYLKCKKARRYRQLQVQNGKIEGVEFDTLSPSLRKCYFKGFAFTELPRPFLYVCQWLIHGVLMILPIVDLLNRLISCPRCLHGSILYQDIMSVLIWGFAIRHLQKERKIFYRAHIKHHSVLFMLFWSLSLLVDVFALVSWNSKIWWFVDHGSELRLMELFIFSIRFSSNILLFVLGFVAPGLYKKPTVVVESGDDKKSKKNGKVNNHWLFSNFSRTLLT